jgi:hypothetical protein
LKTNQEIKIQESKTSSARKEEKTPRQTEKQNQRHNEAGFSITETTATTR